MGRPITILGLGGSLRSGSYNLDCIRAAVKRAPDNARVDPFRLNDLPLYNQDQDLDIPEAALRLKEAIRCCDAVLIATPEYNYSFSGVIKNVLDWGSRPYGDNSWDGKPVGIMGSSLGALGTARAQYHMRQVFVVLNMYALNYPEVIVRNAATKFDEEGNLTDSQTVLRIAAMAGALTNWTLLLQEAGIALRGSVRARA
jgi:chromate reductase